MSVQRISERYADSLLEEATQRRALPKIYEDIQFLEQCLQETPSLRHFLASPILQPYRKAAILREIFSADLQDLSLQFVLLVARKGRATYLQDIVTTFLERYHAKQGMVKVTLKVAKPFSKELREEFLTYASSITKKKPLLEVKVRANLLGGFILQVGTQQLDKSVASQYQNLKKILSKSPSKHPK